MSFGHVFNLFDNVLSKSEHPYKKVYILFSLKII